MYKDIVSHHIFINLLVNYIKNKKKQKKQKQKCNTKPIRKKYNKDHESITEICLKMRRLKKEIMRTIKIKTFQMKIEKEKKNI